MIELDLQDAQRKLPDLAEKALLGEEVIIMLGQRRLRLTAIAEPGTARQRGGRRPGGGAWKGRVTIPDAFYEPWTEEEMGEHED